MFALHGFTLATFLCVLAGVLMHTYKQFLSAMRNRSGINHRDYFLRHWHETAAQVIFSLVLWLGLPEVSQVAPQLAQKLGITGEVGVLSSFGCGYVGNSLADFLGGRAKMIAGSGT